MTDISKLIVLAIVAYATYELILKDSPLIKNMGTLKVGGDASSAQVSASTAASGQGQGQGQGLMQGLSQLLPGKKVEHSQIQDIERPEAKLNPNVLPYPQMSNTQGAFEPATGHNFAQLDCFPKDQLVPQDLLPREGGFAESNPAPQGTLSNQNFFDSGYHGGINTQINVNKNANMQLRSDPVIPRRDVGPWSQSTNEGDTYRRQFDIGSA